MGRPKMTKPELFCCGNDALASKPYHYKECGLDNIYLTSGFSFSEVDGEQYVSIENIDGLRKVIGLKLVTEKKTLSPKEIRFLRGEMRMTQSDLAKLLRVDDQTVARWEKRKSKLPGPADLGLRVLFLNSKSAQPEGNEILVKVQEAISHLVEEDDSLVDRMAFDLGHDQRWESKRLRAMR
jgi:DNA-binding transcriptional regulator YiaG